MLIHPWDAAIDDAEWREWLATTERFGVLAVGAVAGTPQAAGHVTPGILVLAQVPTPSQLLGMALVVLAGAAAQRGGRRSATAPHAVVLSDPDVVG